MRHSTAVENNYGLRKQCRIWEGGYAVPFPPLVLLQRYICERGGGVLERVPQLCHLGLPLSLRKAAPLALVLGRRAFPPRLQRPASSSPSGKLNAPPLDCSAIPRHPLRSHGLATRSEVRVQADLFAENRRKTGL